MAFVLLIQDADITADGLTLGTRDVLIETNPEGAGFESSDLRLRTRPFDYTGQEKGTSIAKVDGVSTVLVDLTSLVVSDPGTDINMNAIYNDAIRQLEERVPAWTEKVTWSVV